MDHDQADGFEDDTPELEEEANEDEFDFSERGDDDADDDEEDIEELLGVGFFDAEKYPSCEDCDGGGGLTGVISLGAAWWEESWEIVP